MQQVRDYSDRRISSRCCFCGGDGLTGDHVPSKAFFDEPFPDNLMKVRCCERCNNEFSKDEAYAACVIEVARCGSLDVEREKVRRMLAHDQSCHVSILAAAEAIRNGDVPTVKNARLEKIVSKIASGIATFLSGAWSADVRCQMFVTSRLSGEDRRSFEVARAHEVWPEAGSRLMQTMVMVDDDVIAPQWEVCQDGRFRYLLIQKCNCCEVRLVFSEYLGAVVRCL